MRSIYRRVLTGPTVASSAVIFDGRARMAIVIDLELTRDRSDADTFLLDGVGSLRFEGWGIRRATLEAEGRTWHAGRAGFWRRRVEATDAAGTVVAHFAPQLLSQGGALDAGGRVFELTAAAFAKKRYVLREAALELAVFPAASWGKRTTVAVGDREAVDPLLLLFCAFVSRGLSADRPTARPSSGGGSSPDVTGGGSWT
jgi:hypothetical protein